MSGLGEDTPYGHVDDAAHGFTEDWRRGDWMQTFTGRAFFPLDARVEDIDELDIAHALSLLCRYGGHARRFYSVAEHCVLMSEAVAPEHALWALLHDATEAYVGDVVRPLKRHLPEYVAIEDRLMGVICARFGLKPGMPAAVKEADNRILLDERAALLSAPPRPWGPLEDAEPLGVAIRSWRPVIAEQAYFERLRELTA